MEVCPLAPWIKSMGYRFISHAIQNYQDFPSSSTIQERDFGSAGNMLSLTFPSAPISFGAITPPSIIHVFLRQFWILIPLQEYLIQGAHKWHRPFLIPTISRGFKACLNLKIMQVSYKLLLHTHPMLHFLSPCKHSWSFAPEMHSKTRPSYLQLRILSHQRWSQPTISFDDYF